MSDSKERRERIDDSRSSDCYLPWPADNEPAAFGPIADAIAEAIRFAYVMERQNEDENIPWNGPNIGRDDRSTCLTPKEQLEACALCYALENQGRDALDEIVGIALRLGIEQGRRIVKSSHDYRMLEIEAGRKGR